MSDGGLLGEGEGTGRYTPMYLTNLRHPMMEESKSMDALIGVVNKLHDVLMTLGKDTFEFPLIVVVGEQSSGKSSVLEGLVGMSFLPRGVGVVTRRPLLLRLENVGSKSTGEDKVIFQHVERVFSDLSEVTREIEEETSRVAGNNKGISPEPIVMTLYSKNVASNLTLVDLPGIVKVPMGDQPSDIENVVKDLIMKYVTNPNAIILAVVTANTDIATSESLKIAREVDPNAERTLVVVTKVDLMDMGTNATDILTGKIISTSLGIVGVVNRSQRDIMQGKSMKEAVFEEINFFYNNYPQIAHKHGTKYLAKTMQNVLISHVKKFLPKLRVKIQSALQYHRNHLKLLDGPKGNSLNESLLQILTGFATAFTSVIQGRSTELDTKELRGGARISYIFHEVFGSALNAINPLDEYSRSAIYTAVRNAAGTKPIIFVPEACFEILVKKQIRRLEDPSLRCVQLVHDEMERILYSCESDPVINIGRFPKLSRRVHEIGVKLLKARIPETNALVQNLIDIQCAHISTTHPDFWRSAVGFSHPECRKAPEENPTVLAIESLVLTYFSLVKKTIADLVPKAVMHCLVNHVLERMLPELVSQLYGACHQVEELMEESIAITEQKKTTTRTIDSLEKASAILTHINEGSL